ncbi:endonuclease/exonuclease/phosphatase family protein [Roseobacter sp. YSTF-M11]|uniref:Endonuclease/exonuclease/phosphatase family protein n=1 Tax=Roseobacter insulae TaxID=2859783 RepID=A0A9X1FXG9_9RHOB|nr:endonuclease/exonuclease/phosphatase family protein [Roseobacter insulae]MBW4709361.1 endonuclease/exonuclease/phosphatase family protein [Roseobacter insulae]
MLDSLANGLFWVLAAALVLATVLPLTKSPLGAVRGLAFPRLQIACLAVLLALLSVVLPLVTSGWVTLVLLVVAGVQAGYIVKFTPVWPKQSHGAEADLRRDTDRQIALMSANVKMSNRAYDRLLTQITAYDPDVIMAIEVDDAWVAALQKALKARYAHWVTVPQDNGYGLCLISRLSLANSEVRTLVTRNVPSIRTEIALQSGDAIQLNLLHPEPPVIDHDTKGRDSEIALVGLEAQSANLPVIVAGDLNDVAWSTTTRKFQRLSQLLDPRVGRGLYNTFHADFAAFRWPLDHLFHDARFRLITLERVPHIGSDHFPIFFRLALAPKPRGAEQLDPATVEEKADARDMIRSEQNRDRMPIGEDWEKD